MKRKLILSGLVLILLAQSAFVLSFATYALSWSNLLSGSGGSAASANFQVDFTVGQTVVGAASSPNYQVELGYWAMPPGAVVPVSYNIFLPVIQH